MFEMLSGMLASCSVAARQQWDSQGAFFPETVFFDGLAPLPDHIAAEMRELYLLRKPWSERSQRFFDYAATKIPHSSRWNWMSGGKWANGRWQVTERGGGPFGPVTHIFFRGAKYAYQYWLRYEYTRDDTWLEIFETAFPPRRPFVSGSGDDAFDPYCYHVNSGQRDEFDWNPKSPSADYRLLWTQKFTVDSAESLSLRQSPWHLDEIERSGSTTEYKEAIAPKPQQEFPIITPTGHMEGHPWTSADQSSGSGQQSRSAPANGSADYSLPRTPQLLSGHLHWPFPQM